MKGYPLNLILAVATAAATIFIGFLPVKTIKSAFFAREALKAAIAWIFVAMATPQQIIHYMFFFAILCAGSWWKFRADSLLAGKMWLSVASGIGISVGVMLLLVTSPSDPSHLPQTTEFLLLASVYLGGAIIGLAYVCYLLTENISNNSGVTNALVQRYVGLLLALTLARAVVLLIPFFAPSLVAQLPESHGLLTHTSYDALVVKFGPASALAGTLILVALAFFAQRTARLASRVQPTRLLIAFILLAVMVEILARLLGL